MTLAITLPHPIRLLAATPDGAQLVAVHETTFTRVDRASGAVLGGGPVPGVVYACAVSPDGRALLLGTRTPVVVNLATGRVEGAVLRGPTSASNGVVWSASGDAVFLAHGSFAATNDTYVYAFDASTRALRWRCAPTPRDGVTDVAVLGERVMTFGEQGMVVLLDAARGASLGRVSLVEPAAYGASMVRGVRYDDEGAVASTLDDGAVIVARVGVGAGALPVKWRASVELDEADEEEPVVAGRPMVVGDAVHVPVRFVVEGVARLAVVTLDGAAGEVRGECELDGAVSHHAVLALPDGALAWAAGNTLRVESLDVDE